MEFRLKTEFIELDNLLKTLGLVAGGADARQQIQAGLIRVNGEVELRIRRKLRPGDTVEFSGNVMTVTAKE